MQTYGGLAMGVQRGLIGMFLSDLDEKIVPEVFRSLARALYRLKDVSVDMFICLRSKDSKVRKLATIMQPPSIGALHFLEIDYEYISVQGAFEPPIEVTCGARDLIRKHALHERYHWAFFLDSGIVLQNNTLQLLLQYKKGVVAVPYLWKSYPHPVVMVCNEKGDEEMLINPHLYKTKMPLIPCTGVGLGATLVRGKALLQPITMGQCPYILEGGAAGFCENLIYNSIQAYCLKNHLLENIGPQRSILHHPFIDDKNALLMTMSDIRKHWGRPDFIHS
jgi:hypothetical protein